MAPVLSKFRDPSVGLCIVAVRRRTRESGVVDLNDGRSKRDDKLPPNVRVNLKILRAKRRDCGNLLKDLVARGRGVG